MAVKQVEIGIIQYSNMLKSGLYGIEEILDVANRLGREYIKFNLSILSADNLNSLTDTYNAIIVLPAIGNNLLDKVDPQLCNFIINNYKKGATIASACSGTFILAQTGLLEGRIITIQNEINDLFAKNYSTILTSIEKNTVIDGNIITSAGIMKWTHLTLEVIKIHGYDELVKELSSFYQIELDSSSGFRFNPSFDHGDQSILMMQKVLKERYAQTIDFDKLASDIGMSRRTLQRKLQKNTGYTPIEYLRFLRLEKACLLLEFTQESVENIIRSIGYDDLTTFRKFFKLQLGLSPVEYRLSKN